QITTGQSRPRCHSSPAPAPSSGSATSVASAADAMIWGSCDSRTTSGRWPRPFQESTLDDLCPFTRVVSGVSNPTLCLLLIFSEPVQIVIGDRGETTAVAGIDMASQPRARRGRQPIIGGLPCNDYPIT